MARVAIPKRVEGVGWLAVIRVLTRRPSVNLAVMAFLDLRRIQMRAVCSVATILKPQPPLQAEAASSVLRAHLALPEFSARTTTLPKVSEYKVTDPKRGLAGSVPTAMVWSALARKATPFWVTGVSAGTRFTAVGE